MYQRTSSVHAKGASTSTHLPACIAETGGGVGEGKEAETHEPRGCVRALAFPHLRTPVKVCKGEGRERRQSGGGGGGGGACGGEMGGLRGGGGRVAI